MTRLKNEEDMRECAGISNEYNTWKNHDYFRIFRNACPDFIKHPILEGFLLSEAKYLIRT
jgi:hypothetical protein